MYFSDELIDELADQWDAIDAENFDSELIDAYLTQLDIRENDRDIFGHLNRPNSDGNDDEPGMWQHGAGLPPCSVCAGLSRFSYHRLCSNLRRFGAKHFCW